MSPCTPLALGWAPHPAQSPLLLGQGCRAQYSLGGGHSPAKIHGTGGTQMQRATENRARGAQPLPTLCPAQVAALGMALVFPRGRRGVFLGPLGVPKTPGWGAGPGRGVPMQAPGAVSVRWLLPPSSGSPNGQRRSRAGSFPPHPSLLPGPGFGVSLPALGSVVPSPVRVPQPTCGDCSLPGKIGRNCSKSGFYSASVVPWCQNSPFGAALSTLGFWASQLPSVPRGAIAESGGWREEK